MMLMMPMWFEWSDRVVLLFKGFGSEKGETGKYLGMLMFTMAIGLAIEAIGFVRYRALKYESCSKGEVGIGFKLTQTFLYGLEVALAYMLMLAVMSFNVGVFICTCLGLTLGHFILAPFKDTIDKKVAELKKECEPSCCKDVE